MWLVTVSSFLLLAWRTSGQQLWPKEVILVRKYPVDYPDEKPVPIQEPPLKRGVMLLHGGLKRDVSVYPAAGSGMMPRVPLREPPLKRSADYFVERTIRSEYPIDLLRLPMREPPLVKRSAAYPPYMHIPLREPPLKRSLEALLRRRSW